MEYYIKHAATVREQVLMPELILRFISDKEEAGQSNSKFPPQTIYAICNASNGWLWHTRGPRPGTSPPRPRIPT